MEIFNNTIRVVDQENETITFYAICVKRTKSLIDFILKRQPKYTLIVHELLTYQTTYGSYREGYRCERIRIETPSISELVSVLDELANTDYSIKVEGGDLDPSGIALKSLITSCKNSINYCYN
jgi:hypothetical protein